MKSIDIRNFKNFQHLKIDDLGAVNLIVGKNNTGKSTLLEAISLLASGGSVSWIRTLLELRGINTRAVYNEEDDDFPQREIDNFCYLYNNRDSKRFMTDPISICASGSGKVELRLVEVAEITETAGDGSETRKRVVRDNPDDGDTIDSDTKPALMITANDTNRTLYTFGRQSPRYYMPTDKSTPFEYVRTAEFTGEKNPALFDKITLTPLETELIEALHVIDPRIEAINFLKENRPMPAYRDQRVPYVVLNGTREKTRLSAMGDGVNRVLTIILSLLNCRNGILLVDEFENGLHYSVQEDLWRLIAKLANGLNVQVFATTHSEDCIKSFLRATRQADNSRLIRLEKRRAGEIAVVYADKDELNYIMDNDVETR